MWKDSYLVGVETIDIKHKQLFGYVKELMEALQKDVHADEYRAHISESINFLKDYTMMHFAEEEAYQKEIGYEDAAAHKVLHEKLKLDLATYAFELVKTNFDRYVVKRFLGFIMTWLVHHIGSEDQQIPRGVKTTTYKHIEENIIDLIAIKAVNVLKIITGMHDDEINYAIIETEPISTDICYKVDFINATKRGAGFVFSRKIAKGVLGAMADIDMEKAVYADYDEMVFSAMQEISDIISSKIAEVVREDDKMCSVDVPFRIDADMLPPSVDCVEISTKIGNLNIIIF